MSAHAYLIVGLGNPGSEYQHTRHNVGFRVVEALASRLKLTFKREARFEGRLAVSKERGVLLLLPSTFMNRSGEAVKACLDAFGLTVDQLMVVSDDVALPLGSIRLRRGGSSGGHNGLKSVEANVGTENYARLRIGVGGPEGEPLSDYVLDSFLPKEEEVLEKSIERALLTLELWLQQGLSAAMHAANAKKELKGEENGKEQEPPL